jgi:hypothetical protein
MSINFMNFSDKKSKTSFHYTFLGFQDYQAARFLFRNDFFFQGMQLTSTTIEKYFKALLALKNTTVQIHLNKLDKMIKILRDNKIPEIDKADPKFLYVLSLVYKLRYFDKLKKEESFGILINQVLGELDFLVNLIETKITCKNHKGEIIKLGYKKAVEEKDSNLFYDNYILNNIDKKEFMERKSKFYSIQVSEDGNIYELIGDEVSTTYTGEINIGILKYQNKNNNAANK